MNFWNFFEQFDNKTKEKSLVDSNKIIRILKFVFGKYGFESLYKFFVDISIQNDFNIIIFTTRRCHILFSIFKKYVFTDKEKYKLLKGHKLYISDKAICFYKKEINNSKVLIADDIMIHGRALNDIKSRVECFAPKKIKVAVYAISDDSPKEDINFELTLINKEWKDLSNKIVASIILTSTPYASYLYAFTKKMPKEEFEKIKLSLDQNFIIKNNNLNLKDITLDLSLDEVNNTDELNLVLKKYIQGYIYPLNSNINEGREFLRVYYNEYTEVCILIPTVFLKEYTKEELEEECKRLGLSKMLKFQPEALYRALTAYYSLSILRQYREFIPDLSDSTWNVNDETVNMSYYKHFYIDLQKAININNLEIKFIYNESNILKDFNLKDYSVLNKKNNQKLENDIYLETFNNMISAKKQSIKSNSEEKNFLLNYICQVDINEEQNWEKKKIKAEKQIGFSFVLSKIIFDYKIITPFKFYSQIIYGSDSGLFTFYADKFSLKDEILYSNFLVTGEQVCRLYQDKYFLLVLCLSKYYFEIKNNHSKYIDFDLEDYIKRVLSSNISDEVKREIEQKFESLKDKNSKKMEENINFYFKNIYKEINDWNLESILHNAYDFLLPINEEKDNAIY